MTEAASVLPAEFLAVVGREMPEARALEEITKSERRRYLQATLNKDPLYYDDEYARTTKFGPGVCPADFVVMPTFVWKIRYPLGGKDPLEGLGPDDDDQMEDRYLPEPIPEDWKAFHGGDEGEFYQLPRLGDWVTTKSRVADIIEKTGSTGRIFVAKRERTYYNQNGDLLARIIGNLVARRRADITGTISPPSPAAGAERTTPLGGGKVVDAPGYETPYFDDVEVGDQIPPTPLLLILPMMVRWVAMQEGWRRDHYDPEFAKTRDMLPGVVMSGSWTFGYQYQLLARWAGHEGWVWKFSQSNRRMAHPGDTVTFSGRVTDRYERNGLGYVELDTALTRQDGVVAVPGNATVVLPLRGGRGVPYPFQP